MIDVYVGNLSRRVRVDDVRELFDGVSEKKTFGFDKVSRIWSLVASLFSPSTWTQNLFTGARKSSPAAELNFTIVENTHGQFARYCLISGYSRMQADRLISQFSGVGFQGQMLEVRPFHMRVLENDRRRAGWHFRRWLGIEHRKGERRLQG